MRRKVVVLAISLFVLFFSLHFVSITSAQDKAEEGGLGQKKLTLFEFLKHGGPVFVMIIACSMFTLSIIVERVVYYRKLKTIGGDEKFIETIIKTQNLKQAIGMCSKSSGIVPRVMKVVLDNHSKGLNKEIIESKVEARVIQETMNMEKFLPQLDTMVTLTPLLGLFGTVLGMIKSFNVVASLGMGKPEMLAGGISEALINTAGGLGVAIPALFFYNYLSGKKESYILGIEKAVSDLILQLDGFKREETKQPLSQDGQAQK
jgi:biopolymer transport protein ExbB